MKRCEKCRIEFSGDLDRCPLCQAELAGRAEPAVFPRNEVRKSGTVALAVLAFATGACALVMLFVGRMLSLPGDIVVATCAALIVNYLFVRNILTHSPDFLRVVVRYFLILLGIAAVWFVVTGNLAVTTFVIPGICLVAIVFDAVLLAVFRGTFVTGYAKYLLFDVLLGLAPLALAAFGLVTWDVPALASALAASVFLLGLLVFTRKQLVAELRKLFSA
ncbi:DUF6320 domain-containing protein [Arabiibacter massiliensis]|uniref:DUF6320 domain-containing protein n=1 Tax=Arabiibacter massiliensis TaxID=1870985 RepID=UPI0009B946F1|nr:DUF6320 domain-containing protein [Arabiibacter massiliensis]